MDKIKQELPTNLEEAADDYAVNNAVYYYEEDDDEIHRNIDELKLAFIAGADWQKEQDQPITGNSLEQEWLRYVDKKKKENGGELPSLGEYGWLQIARHFYELGKNSK